MREEVHGSREMVGAEAYAYAYKSDSKRLILYLRTIKPLKRQADSNIAITYILFSDLKYLYKIFSYF